MKLPLLVALLAGILPLVWSAEAAPTGLQPTPTEVAASVTLNPRSGPIGTRVTAEGDNWACGTGRPDVVYWDNRVLESTTNDRCALNVSFIVPQNATRGTHTVRVVRNFLTSTYSGTATFTVFGLAPRSTSINPYANPYAPVPTPTVRRPNPFSGVQLCSQPNYGGTCDTFVSDNPDLISSRVGNDGAASVRFPGITREISLYEHSNFRGGCQSFSSNVSDLQYKLINSGTVSSLRIGPCPRNAPYLWITATQRTKTFTIRDVFFSVTKRGDRFIAVERTPGWVLAHPENSQTPLLWIPVDRKVFLNWSVRPPNHPIPITREIIYIPGIILNCSSGNDVLTFCDNDDSYDAENRAFSETFSTIGEQTTAANYQWRAFNYSSGWRTSRSYFGIHTRLRIEESASVLSQQIRFWGTAKRYTIIAHSLGGAVALYWAATETNAQVFNAVDSIITLDSPLSGFFGLTNLEELLAWSGGEAGADLQDEEVVKTILSAVDFTNVFSFGNTRDEFVSSSSSIIDGGCPQMVWPCRISAAEQWPYHSEILSNRQVINWINDILAE
jgi:hypothetical protein